MCNRKIIDPSSLANLAEVTTQHLHFNWTISFTEKKIYGHVLLDLITVAPNVNKVVLDTSYLDLQGVSLNGNPLEVRLYKATRDSW
jgi:leukotriene-A4 hydrolase